MTTATLHRIPLEQLHESPLNPRKHYDEVALKQLAESMLASGQITPITVRPSRNGKGGYEIAAGHRRTRAAALAGLPELDAVLRDDLRDNDPAFIEILNVENLQRDDLHPLEEAQGFRTLMEKAGYDIPKIAARIGKSTKYVYDRIKLLQLIKPAQKLFLEGAFEAGHAIILARLSKEDQARAIGDPDDRHNFADNRVGGLFLPEHIDDGLELEDRQPRKPASVREFQHWVDDNVRFIPEKEDLPNLFPATAAALVEAKEEELKVVKITRDYRVPDEAKDPKERTYGEASWKRADGQSEPGRYSGKASPAKTCEFAVLGVVVAGPGRGEAFKVCVNKDKCSVHWAADKAERARRAKANATGSSGGTDNSWQREEARRKVQEEKDRAVQARWKTAEPALLEAVDAAIAKAPTNAGGALARLVLEKFLRNHRKPKGEVLGKTATAEAVLRYLGRSIMADTLNNHYWAAREAPGLLDRFGIDAEKIVDQAAPKEPPAAKATKPAKAKAKKRLAGDVARARKKAKAKKGGAR